MTVTITRKTTQPELKRKTFSGPLLDRPIQFPEDVKIMKGWLLGKGLVVGDKDCQALWSKLSEAYYPFGKRPVNYAPWLTMGQMMSIFDQHAHEFLCDVGDAVR